MKELRDGEKLVQLKPGKRKHKSAKRRYMIMLLAVIAVFLAVYFFVFRNQTYSDHKVLDYYARDDGGTGDFLEFNGCLVRYSPDGIVGMDHQGKELWQDSFEMQTPLTAVSGDVLAIAEKEGNKIYLFSSSGKLGEIATPKPVQSICVCPKEIVGVIMRDGTHALLVCYNKNGEELVESKASLGGSGYPLAAALSDDGTQLLVSYILPGDVLKSRVVCYRFGKDERAEGELAVLEEEYEDLLIPFVAFVGNTGVAAGDGSLFFYSADDPEKAAEKVTFDSPIVSVLTDSDHVGVILRNTKGNKKYSLRVYQSGGRETANTDFNYDFTSARMQSGKIILLNNDWCTIYNSEGRQIFKDTFNDSIVRIYPEGGVNKYLVVLENSIETIRLMK